MNERIRQLMGQAGKLAYEEHKAKCLKEGLNPSMPYGNSLGKIFEKFAELIVGECIECADFVGRVNIASGYPNSTAHHVKQKIKQHFGVEE